MHIPETEQMELCSRFRSGNDIQFGTAFQELFLHEFLRCQQCAIEFHPSVPGTTSRPDFLVRPPDGEEFILEARTSTDMASGPESDPKGDRVREFLQQIKLDGYRLGISELTVGKSDLRQRGLGKHVIDAIAAHSGGESNVQLPDYVTADGWRIDQTRFSARTMPTAVGQRLSCMKPGTEHGPVHHIHYGMH